MKATKILSIDIDYCKSSRDFQDVCKLFYKNLFQLDKSKILFSDYHVDILDLIKKTSGPLDITNIDDHHDIFYDQAQVPVLRNGMPDSSCWLGWLFLNAQVTSYRWISQEFSEAFSSELIDAFENIYEKSSQYDIIDSRNILFSNKKAVTERMSDSFIKYKPFITRDIFIDDEIFDIAFDYIFVCKSPDYTPKENYFLYYILKSAASEFFKKPKNEKKI
jgi:hypothetical protein